MEVRRKLSCTEVYLRVERIGEDCCVLIGGGDRPHIGCAVMAIPRPSLEGNGEISVTSSVLNVTGHKDEYICRLAAEEIAKCRNRITVCTGGVHVDGISKKQIQEITDAMMEMVNELIELFKQEDE